MVPWASYRWHFSACTHAYLPSTAFCFGGPQSASSGLSSALAGVSSSSLFPWESNACIPSKASCTIGKPRRLLVWAKSITKKPNQVVVFRAETGLVQQVSLSGLFGLSMIHLRGLNCSALKSSLLVRKKNGQTPKMSCCATRQTMPTFPPPCPGRTSGEATKPLEALDNVFSSRTPFACVVQRKDRRVATESWMPTEQLGWETCWCVVVCFLPICSGASIHLMEIF